MADLPETYADRGVWAGLKTGTLRFARLRIEENAESPRDWSILVPGFAGKKESAMVFPFDQLKNAYPNLSQSDEELTAHMKDLTPSDRILDPDQVRSVHLKNSPRFGQSLRLQKRGDIPEEGGMDDTMVTHAHMRLVVQLMRITGEAHGEKDLKSMNVNTYMMLMKAGHKDAATGKILDKFNLKMFKHLGEQCGCSVDEAMERLSRFAHVIAPAIQVDSADDTMHGHLVRARNRMGGVLSDLEDARDEMPEVFQETLNSFLFPFEQFLGIAAKELAKVERRANNLEKSLRKIDKAIEECERSKLQTALALDGWQPLCEIFEAALESESPENMMNAIEVGIQQTPLVPKVVLDEMDDELEQWRDFTKAQSKMVKAMQDWRTGRIDRETAGRQRASG